MNKAENSFDENKRWLALIISYLVMAAMSVTIQVLSPVSHKIQEIIGIDYAKLGFLMGSISIPGIILSVPGGYIADRWGRIHILYAGIICLIIGALIFLANRNYEILCLARIVSGIGCAILSVILPGIFSPYFKDKSLGAAMGIFNTALPLGSILTLTFMGNLGRAAGWFNVFWVPACVAALMLVLIFLFLPDKNTMKSIKDSRVGLPMERDLLLLALIVLFSNMATMGYVTIAPAYFEKINISFSIIGIMLSAVLWGSLLLSPVAGYLTGHRNMAGILLLSGCFFQALSLVFIPIQLTPFWIDLVILGISSGLIMTPVYILVPKAVSGGQLNMGYGVIMTAMMIGCLSGPFLAGVSVDRFGGFMAGFLALGIFSFIGSVTSLFLRKQISTEK